MRPGHRASRPPEKNPLLQSAVVIQWLYHTMKTTRQEPRTATVRELRNRFGDVAKWIADGEEVTITRSGTVFATLAPAQPKPTLKADWAARFKQRQAIPAKRKLTKLETQVFYAEMKGA